jgi:hypothetical protein
MTDSQRNIMGFARDVMLIKGIEMLKQRYSEEKATIRVNYLLDTIANTVIEKPALLSGDSGDRYKACLGVLKIDLPADGIAINLIPRKTAGKLVPRVEVGYQGLLALIRRDTGYNVFVETFSIKEMEKMRAKEMHLPKPLTRAMLRSDIIEWDIAHVTSTTALIVVHVKKGEEYIHTHAYTRDEMLEREQYKLYGETLVDRFGKQATGIWADKIRKTDSLEMLKKTAIKLACKTLSPTLNQAVSIEYQ